MKEHIERFVDNMELEAKFRPLNNELHIVEGYASTEGIDLAGHNIPLEAMNESLPRFMNNELFRNLMVSHNSTQVGVILDKFDGVKTHVNEKGIYFVAQIRDDIKTANKLWDLIQSNESEIGVSIKFEIVENEQVCNKEKCWTNILKFNIIEFSLTDKGVNPDCSLILSETIKEGEENITKIMEVKSMDENTTDNTETEETSTEMSVSELRDYVNDKFDVMLGQMGELTASIASIKEELSVSDKVDDNVVEESKTDDELVDRVDVVEKSLGDMSLKLEDMDSSEVVENLQKSINARDELIEGQKEEIQKLNLRVEELENEPSTKFVSEGKTNETPIMETYTDQFGTVSRIN